MSLKKVRIMTSELKKVKPKPQMAKIIKVVKETRDTSTLRLKLSDPFQWQPGQFIMVIANINGDTVRRAYSIASSPTRDYLEITIRQTETPTMSKYLNEVVEGEELEVKGPYGNFIWNENASPKLVCLGAGSGITPFRGFMEYFIDKNLDTPFKLLYSCRYGDNVIYEKELRELVHQLNNGYYELSITRGLNGLEYPRTGHIDKDYLTKEIKGFEDASYYLCGSPGFIESMINTLQELGIPRNNIKREQWG